MTSLNPLDEEMTIGQFLGWIAPKVWTDWDNKKQLPWPADIFGLSLSLLRRAGAYLNIVHEWPASGYSTLDDWTTRVRNVGKEWRRAWENSVFELLPTEVVDAWQVIRQNSSLKMSSIFENHLCRNALIFLVVSSDEAFDDFLKDGFSDGSRSNFFESANKSLRDSHTLCLHVHPSRMRVLPKGKTPQGGFTTRSLSHSLALCQGIEVNAKWYNVDTSSFNSQEPIHVLVVPYPFEVLPCQFGVAAPKKMEMPGEFGYFSYHPNDNPSTEILADWVVQLVEEANKNLSNGHQVNLIIFPEAALCKSRFDAIIKQLSKANLRAAVIAGITEPCIDDTGWAENHAICSFEKTESDEFMTRVQALQAKHHRWYLDERQISYYKGLDSSLPTTDGKVRYWEGIDLKSREVHFLNFNNQFIMCLLVCEDLTRVDPVGELVRSVAPDFILAILQDGPQIEARWPGKYGTVLAEDPGSSVLTVSSAGMIRMSIDSYLASGKTMPNSAVALWKDATTGQEIDLNDTNGELDCVVDGKCEHFPNQAVLFTLNLKSSNLFSADGRKKIKHNLVLDKESIKKIKHKFPDNV